MMPRPPRSPPLYSSAASDVYKRQPIVSAFSAPIYYVIGDIGLGVLIASWIIQIACILLIHKVSSKVYDSLIMYKGSRLKTGQILAMAGRKGVK